MAKMSPQERAELEAKLAADDEEDDDDYEIEIYSPTGHGARVPYRKGKSYLQQHFGIDADTLPKPEPAKASGKSASKAAKGGSEGTDDNSEGEDPQNLSFFQRREHQRQSAS